MLGWWPEASIKLWVLRWAVKTSTYILFFTLSQFLTLQSGSSIKHLRCFFNIEDFSESWAALLLDSFLNFFVICECGDLGTSEIYSCLMFSLALMRSCNKKTFLFWIFIFCGVFHFPRQLSLTLLWQRRRMAKNFELQVAKNEYNDMNWREREKYILTSINRIVSLDVYVIKALSLSRNGSHLHTLLLTINYIFIHWKNFFCFCFQVDQTFAVVLLVGAIRRIEIVLIFTHYSQPEARSVQFSCVFHSVASR